jgi:hypothetical protein
VEDLRVVVDADPLALVGDQLEQPVLLEREREELDERPAEHCHDHGERGEQQRVGRDRPADVNPGPTTSRPCGRLDRED